MQRTYGNKSLLQISRHFTLDGLLNGSLGDPIVIFKHCLQVGVAPCAEDLVEPSRERGREGEKGEIGECMAQERVMVGREI